MANDKKKECSNFRSSLVTKGVRSTASRGMLRALGMGEKDFNKVQVGIASSWNEITPCNLSLNRLAQSAKNGIFIAGGFPMQFGTISVSDGISMGHEGMHFSLVSREIIADSVETVIQAERLDGVVLLAGCDKSLPGMLMASARLNLPSIFLYAGSMLPGSIRMSNGLNKQVTLIDAFEAIGSYNSKILTKKTLKLIERNICPGEGACSGMYTANTMACVAEILGMSILGSASPPSVDKRRDLLSRESGELAVNLINNNIKSRDIMTKKAFLNAITVVMSLGGSTNAVLHLLAIAKEAKVNLSIDEFDEISNKTPHIANLKPFGKYVMADLDKIGGLPVVIKALLDKNLIYGDTLTVTGKTLEEDILEISPGKPDGNILYPIDKPISTNGGISILRGSLAPEGAVVKTAGIKIKTFEGPAKVFEREQSALEALRKGEIHKGDVLVIRYEGPKGGPGMREMLAITGAVKGFSHLNKNILLLTDGRFSGGTTGLCIGHISPEASNCGPIALVKNGDLIKVDLLKKQLNLLVKPSELNRRKKYWKAIKPFYREGVLGKYSKLVGSASKGAYCE